jgi:septal ring factor EnvC (AmiA/AmiB activator)
LARKSAFYILIFFIFSLNLHAQRQTEIKRKNSELSRLKSEISNLEKKIKTYSHKETLTSQELENIEKQIFLYDKLISDLRKEISATEKKIGELKRDAASTEKRISDIKKVVQKYAVWLYKMNEPTVWDLLADPKSFNENLEMRYYFEYFANNAKAKIDSLERFEAKLKDIKKQKEKQRAELQKLIAEKRKNKAQLVKVKKRKNKFLAKIRNDKKRAREIVKQKRKEEQRISAIIGRLIKEEEEAAKERARMLAARKKGREKAHEEEVYSYATGVKFAALKGKMPWPVRGRVEKKFGKVQNKKLHTVSINNGIDIKTSPKAKVKAVADGIVSAVEWLPGYGPIVIITHGSKYRTVYGFVDDFQVTKGEKVKAGQTLGSVATSVNGNVIHFEIWNKRKPENPEKWLGRK